MEKDILKRDNKNERKKKKKKTIERSSVIRRDKEIGKSPTSDFID